MIPKIVKYSNEEKMLELKKFLNNDMVDYLIQCYLDELEECEAILSQIAGRENGKKLIRHFKIQ